jgi:hypothetical protein
VAETEKVKRGGESQRKYKQVAEKIESKKEMETERADECWRKERVEERRGKRE